MSKNTPVYSSHNGCGCGGSGGSDCHCGKPSCEQCRLDGFVRPRFFSGQLLTEEDLQLLDAYTVAKNRLHNRHFWGDGVVCGLEVKRHPCDKGSVIVSPGYALDCCGNDIVVACPQELDVNRLVRELSVRLKGGFDCGDPCGDKKMEKQETLPKQSALPAPGTVSGSIGLPPTPTTTDNDNHGERPVPSKFCLYVNYCESESDPVAPYATGDPCGASGCEPSRVREGFTFELRCEKDKEPRPSIQNALCKCVQDKTKLEKASAAADYARRARARLMLPGGDPAVALAEANKKLEAFRSSTIDATWVKEKFDATMNAAEPVVVYTARTLAPPPGGVDVQGSAAKRKAAAAAEAERLANAPLGFVASLADESAVKEELAKRTELERVEAQAIMAKAALLMGGTIDEPERARLAAGLIITPELIGAIDRLTNEVRSQAANAQLAATTIVSPLTSTSSPAQINAAVTAYGNWERAIQNHYQECFCNAILPPCASCEELGVLVACISVLDCEIVEICNLERRFVLTPVNLRYWAPEIDAVGESIEAACCGDENSQDSTLSKGQTYIPAVVLGYWFRLLRSCLPPDKRMLALVRPAGRAKSEIDTIEAFLDPTRLADIERRLEKLEQK
jgi:hypothetical protein